MPSRRSLLAAAAGFAAAPLAGCPSPFDGENDRHYVDVYNYADGPHVFVVTATDEAGETLFEHEYDLGPGTGDENRVVDGTPAGVAVVVDGTDREQFDWAPAESPGFAAAYPDGCPEATTTSLTIRYGLTPGTVTPTYGCETVRDG